MDSSTKLSNDMDITISSTIEMEHLNSFRLPLEEIGRILESV